MTEETTLPPEAAVEPELSPEELLAIARADYELNLTVGVGVLAATEDKPARIGVSVAQGKDLWATGGVSTAEYPDLDAAQDAAAHLYNQTLFQINALRAGA